MTGESVHSDAANRDPLNREGEWFRPLDRIWSLKLKLGILIVAAIGIAVAVSLIGYRLGVPIWLRPIISITISLAMVQVLARGMTYPLREMARAASAMAKGDYSQRVTATAADEVGQLGRAFNQMAADLEQVERQRRELVANASHELRTPLTALQLNLENLVDGVTPPNDKTLSVMLSQTERLSRLVAQLLDLSRLESGNSPLAHNRFSVTAMLRRAAVEAELLSPDITIKVDAPAGLELHGDGERVHQVVANLLENAVRYTPVGQPIEVHAARVDDHVRIDVADLGPGIAPDERSRVFERFHRADEDRSRKKGGAGLGLSIAQWVVDLHGGTIHVEANEPVGARFVVTLPAEPGAP